MILSALSLFLYNCHKDAHAGQESESLMADIELLIAAQLAESSTPNQSKEAGAVDSPSPAPLDPELPAVILEGYEYVGYVEIPTLWVKLPVMADWNYNRLEIAPCRQFGSSRTDDLVIVAHNYRSHFGGLKDLKEGDSVIFTDMEGIINTYSVAKIETLKPTDVDTVQNSDYDLVLYTCTYGGQTRVAVFCNRSE